MMPLPIPPLFDGLLSKPVAIFGAGRSGRAVKGLLDELGLENHLYDELAGLHFSQRDCARHTLVVFSPGFALDHPWLQSARAQGLYCMGELDFSGLFWREQLRAEGIAGELVAVTGTNGKTTVTEFLTHALTGLGLQAVAAGNIGKPLAEIVVENHVFGLAAQHTAAAIGGAADCAEPARQIVVCEVSSFQAESLQHFRCEWVLWTNFAEDHFDRHGSRCSYFEAKARLLAAAPAGAILLGSSAELAARQNGQTLPPATRVKATALPVDPRLEGTVFASGPQRENFALVAAFWARRGLEPEALYAASRRFKIGAHRLQPVATIEGVEYWNDSKATNFHAVEAALASFEGSAQRVFLILGGRSKGGDLQGFVERIAPRCAQVFLMGETRAALREHCRAVGLAHSICDSLHDAVHLARRAAQASAAAPNPVILLSPGFASFDCFRNYQERGEAFVALVRNCS